MSAPISRWPESWRGRPRDHRPAARGPTGAPGRTSAGTVRNSSRRAKNWVASLHVSGFGAERPAARPACPSCSSAPPGRRCGRYGPRRPAAQEPAWNRFAPMIGRAIPCRWDVGSRGGASAPVILVRASLTSLLAFAAVRAARSDMLVPAPPRPDREPGGTSYTNSSHRARRIDCA